MLSLFERTVGIRLYNLSLPLEHRPIRELVTYRHTLFMPDLVSLLAMLLPNTPEPVIEHSARLAGIPPGMGTVCLALTIDGRTTGVLSI